MTFKQFDFGKRHSVLTATHKVVAKAELIRSIVKTRELSMAVLLNVNNAFNSPPGQVIHSIDDTLNDKGSALMFYISLTPIEHCLRQCPRTARYSKQHRDPGACGRRGIYYTSESDHEDGAHVIKSVNATLAGICFVCEKLIST